jgi:hypothetical protein
VLIHTAEVQHYSSAASGRSWYQQHHPHVSVGFNCHPTHTLIFNVAENPQDSPVLTGVYRGEKNKTSKYVSGMKFQEIHLKGISES